jgi:cation diffusion facilitator family transporter
VTSRTESQPGRSGPSDLTRFAWLSVSAALTTLALKAAAAWMTGSVGLLSDAAESVVNLVAALVALLALRVAARPPDEGHNFGHGKAEYLSATVEAVLIFVAAVGIVVTAVQRLVDPQPLVNVGPGLLVSGVAGAVNGAVALTLTRAGRRHRSLALTADGKHLMTDVWTSVGVVVGVGLVVLTGNLRVDPVVALLVALNIMVTGLGLLRKAVAGLMDKAIPDAARTDVEHVLDDFARCHGIGVHAVRTRAVGRIHLVSVHLVVPPEWTVARSHALTLELEAEMTARLQDTYLQTHVEPSGQRCPETTP